MTNPSRPPLDLDSDKLRRWTTPCGQHDYCENTDPCTCPEGDPRIHMVELVAEVERLRGELAMWRDDVSGQWRDECIRLQGEVERLTREQLNADIAAGSQPEAGAR